MDRTPMRSKHRHATAAMTLAEILIALTVFGLLMGAVTQQLIESTSLSLRVSHAVEHSRSARELMSRITRDVENAQVIVLYRSFSDRATPRRDGELGNYLAVHWLDAGGAVTRTVGYYALPAPSGTGWLLYRHDSADGDSTAGSLPDALTSGTHRVVIRAVRLPDSDNLFRCWRDRGVFFRGEFGTGNESNRGANEFIQCTISTRS